MIEASGHWRASKMTEGCAMAVLQWVEDLNTGIEEIDIQHRRIVDYINRLHELRESPDRAALSEVIAETVDYTISHFAYEERMLEDSGYAFTDLHKRVHELFTRRVGEMQTRFDVNKLKLEKSELANRNKQIALTGTLVLLLAVIGWSLYQRIMVKRLKRMHKELVIAHEEVRKQSIRATESEKMKTAFLNSICHEIRTPLNSISGFSELIFDESLDMDTKREFQHLIQSNSAALAALMDNMLELSKLVSSDLPLPVEPADVYGLCIEEMSALEKTISKKEIKCIFEGDKDGSMVPTNTFYLCRVIGNLLSNAAKFTESGTITLTCNVEKKKGQLVISVADTGIGIPADKQEWVFERFTKVDDFKPGTGLGLYICRIIIQRLGGQISIDSGYTSGCKMVVTLPV